MPGPCARACERHHATGRRWLALTFLPLLPLAGLCAPPALGARRAVSSHRRANVILMTVDEMSVDNLRRGDGQVDAKRYPNFAALARRSTWFRNTVAVTSWTYYSMPAILDGRVPAYGSSPEAPAHPVSLFTALAKHGYGIVDTEEATRV